MRRWIKNTARALGSRFEIGRAYFETQATQTAIPLSALIAQKVLRRNAEVYWPIHPSSLVLNPDKIVIGIETSPGLMPGCYLQGGGGIVIGDYTQIGPGVGIISSNHDLHDNRRSVYGRVEIGRYCWLGMRSIVLPGVTLGEYTVVAAGAVVTKSCPEGYALLAGVPAKVVKRIDPAACVLHESEHRYHGYIPHERFEDFRRCTLKI